MALISAAGLVILWVLLAAGGTVLPGTGVDSSTEIFPPLLLGVGIFSALAITGAVAALRRAPLVTALCGAIGLVPVGLYTLLLPWPFPLIGVFDGVLVASGVMILRGEPDEP
ncbi:MAG: hypothetical protein VKI81_11050 [Synechococcaceae cyanobacterium]|nr:hypothetical protein [Synechococcaceae cyanobacterium]